MEYKYTLPVGTKLVSHFKDKKTKRTEERTYTIEQVVGGQPLRPGQQVRSDDDVRPVLGQGGFGITYLASREVYDGNIYLGKGYYAIKEFFMKGQCYRDEGSTVMKYSPAAKVQVEEGLKDFEAEARRLKDICRQCRNIVNVNEVFLANGTAYYVMEFIEGGSLQNRVRENGPMSEAEALEMIRPIANALSYIHTKHQLLHCDIKPDNIMIRHNQDGSPDEPVLIDFGIAVHFNTKGELTTTHHIVGTSDGYSPQEQYNGIATLTENRRRAVEEGIKDQQIIPCEVDVYALGATLYYLLTAKKPYSAFMMNSDIIQRTLPKDISKVMREAIVNAMKPSAAERTQTMEELLRNLMPRYTLPRGYVIKSSNARYLITDITGEGESYISYAAMPYSQTDSHSQGSTTKTARYTLYEFFDKQAHERAADESLKAKDPSKSVPYDEPFITLFRRKTQLNAFGQANIVMGHIVCESFVANNTSYFVVEQKWKPTPGWKKYIKKVKAAVALCAARTRNAIVTHRKLLLIFLLSTVAGVALFLAIPPLLRQLSNKADTQPELMIDTAAVDTIAADTAVADTATAEVPVVAEPPSVINDNSAAEAQKKAQEEAAKKKAKQLEEQKEREARKQERQEDVTPKLTEAEIVSKAISSKDIRTLETYANKGNREAIDGAALYYISQPETGSNDTNADRWSKKASPSVRQKVRKELAKRRVISEEDI